MSNKNRNLVNGNTGNETKAKEPGWFKQQLDKINVKTVAKSACKVAVGFCALVGAAGLGSYAADQFTKPKNIPDSYTNPDLDS